MLFYITCLVCDYSKNHLASLTFQLLDKLLIFSVAIYSPVWFFMSVWKDFQNIGLGWLTTKLMMGSLRMLLHPLHINPAESVAAIVTTVSTLILSYSESSKGSNILRLLGTTKAGRIALKKLFQCGFSTILNGEALA